MITTNAMDAVIVFPKAEKVMKVIDTIRGGQTQYINIIPTVPKLFFLIKVSSSSRD